jgi:hypothetical protein
MEELVKMVTEKVGITADKAKMAVEMVVKFLSEKLPAPIASQIKGVLSGGQPSAVADATEGLGDILSKQ